MLLIEEADAITKIQSVTRALDLMPCRSRNFQRVLEINITARFRTLEKIYVS